MHSWNGKFRRPAGLISDDHDGGYDTPMKGDLLWVYEGLTEYLGEVLARRSDLWSPEDYRERLAQTAAALDNKYGRTWRPLEDTAVAAQILYDAGSDYADYRRGVDFYRRRLLIWLDADVTIRHSARGKIAGRFLPRLRRRPGGAPALKPYEFDDVVAALNAVEPYDWAGFLNSRLHSTDAARAAGGHQHAGWKLVYDGERSDFWKAYEDDERISDLSYSVGLKVKEDGTISTLHSPVRRPKPDLRRPPADCREQPPVHGHGAARSDREGGAARSADPQRRILSDLSRRLSRRRTLSAPGARRSAPDLLTAIIAAKTKNEAGPLESVPPEERLHAFQAKEHVRREGACCAEAWSG